MQHHNQFEFVLAACRNLEAIESVRDHHIGHTLREHQEYPQWRQKSIITNDHKKEIHLHSESDDEEERFGYKSIFEDSNSLELQFGAPSNSLNPREAKFTNLKAEMIRNDHYPLNEELFHELLRLCVFLTTSRKSKNMGLIVDEMVALKLYLDFPDLRQYLRRCFHDDDPEKRLDFQRTFYHWNQSIESALNKSRNEFRGRLYLPLFDDAVILDADTMCKLVCFGPTIFHADYESACAFGAGHVTVVEVSAPFSQCGLDVSWLCSATVARRFVFTNTTFQIRNIHSPSMKPLGLEDDDDLYTPERMESFRAAFPTKATFSETMLRMYRVRQCSLRKLDSLRQNQGAQSVQTLVSAPSSVPRGSTTRMLQRPSALPEAAQSGKFQWRNINVFVGNQSDGKQILHDISGEMLSGELLALMGGSGAGMSTVQMGSGFDPFTD